MKKELCFFLLTFLIIVKISCIKRSGKLHDILDDEDMLTKFLKYKKNSAKDKTYSKIMKTNKELNKLSNKKKGNFTLLSDWLHISSKLFHDKNLFPSVILPNNQEISLSLDENDFRINEFFNPAEPDSPPTLTSFWFRLSGVNIYYSINKDDLNVLGAFHIKDIKDDDVFKTTNNQNFCFELIDLMDQNWKICADNIDKQIIWTCEIYDRIGKNIDNCKELFKNKKPKNPTESKNIWENIKPNTIPAILIPIPPEECNENWDYFKKGNDWDCDCNKGKFQSPIDLPLPSEAILSEKKPLFQYDEIFPGFNIIGADGEIMTDQNLKLKLENFVLKINYDAFGRLIYMDGKVFAAKEINFHTPSEHRINGKGYDLEMQIVHFGLDDKNISKKVILSFLFEKKPGVYNQFIDDLDFFNLPNHKNPEKEIKNTLYIPKIFYSLDSEDLTIMKPFSFYSYQGSLTSPPCSEETLIYIAYDPVPLSSTAIDLFREAITTSEIDHMSIRNSVNYFENGFANNRQIQSLNGRKVYFYDHIRFVGPDPDKKKTPKIQGHYEKYEKIESDYIYVSSKNPTDIPNSFVIPEAEYRNNMELKKERSKLIDLFC